MVVKHAHHSHTRSSDTSRDYTLSQATSTDWWLLSFSHISVWEYRLLKLRSGWEGYNSEPRRRISKVIFFKTNKKPFLTHLPWPLAPLCTLVTFPSYLYNSCGDFQTCLSPWRSFLLNHEAGTHTKSYLSWIPASNRMPGTQQELDAYWLNQWEALAESVVLHGSPVE